MHEKRTASPVVLAPAAQADLRDILHWSYDHFGEAAARRYDALLSQALRDLQEDRNRPGVVQLHNAGGGTFSYHLLSSRDRVNGRKVTKPKHFIVFRPSGEVLRVLRILHDARDLPRHLPQ